ncbi:DUF397 domain-containing protein [Streptomyces sp. NPDC056470]|uniref:DUF397 domain-containing protein n=1 Tax=Streptomyces sp. NPDC056470 TaxID=3345831 RepID=UPI003678156D
MSSTELAWFKSSYSSGEGGNCIEVAYDWQQPTHNGAEGAPAAIHVRDSKVPHGPQLAVAPTAWASFVTYAGM